MKLIKENIKDTAKMNRMLMSRNITTDCDEENFITDKIESMFLSPDRMNFKKNDVIDLAFLGCVNELKNNSFDVTFITNDSSLHGQMVKYNHKVALFKDIVGK